LEANEPSLAAYAIGGISLENLDQVLATGIRRVAVSHAIWRSDEPREAAKRFRDRLVQ
jgi:thiamine-phosphate pyrophosphorylase